MATITIETTTQAEQHSVWVRTAERTRAFAHSCMAMVRESSAEPVRVPQRVPGHGLDTFHRAGAPRL